MNAMKFVVLLIFVGVVCANVCARQPEEVSKETKLGISIPETVTTNGIGAELSRVYAVTGANNYENFNARAAAGPDGPSSDTSATVSKSTYGSVDAEGPTTVSASSNSYAYGGTTAGATADSDGSGSSGTAYGDASSRTYGTTNPGAIW